MQSYSILISSTCPSPGFSPYLDLHSFTAPRFAPSTNHERSGIWVCCENISFAISLEFSCRIPYLLLF
ncbi:MAG: hypothetical protein MRJ93_11310 [Nitrososphaeraceae archaeon]|nr:hypothetical protein [Nitrososphaeraceae archaeon]